MHLLFSLTTFIHPLPETQKWTALTSSGPTPDKRDFHRAFVARHYVGIFGGSYDDGSTETCFNDVFLYDTGMTNASLFPLTSPNPFPHRKKLLDETTSHRQRAS